MLKRNHTLFQLNTRPIKTECSLEILTWPASLRGQGNQAVAQPNILQSLSAIEAKEKKSQVRMMRPRLVVELYGHCAAKF